MAVLVETGCYADMTLPTEPGHSAQDLRVFRAPGTFPLIVQRAAVSVLGRPDWLFIKIHAHGMDPLHKDSVAGEPMRNFLEELVRGASDRKETLHFASAREMVNIILAACDGRDGNPGLYRDHRFKRFRDTPRTVGVTA
jgi:hypothetical protein